MRAWLNLRNTLPERVEGFRKGLSKLGYTVTPGFTQSPGSKDILVTWNRIAVGDSTAKIFEDRGLPVIVAENGSWGRQFAGDAWYTLALSRHNTAGNFRIGGPERWEALDVDLAPWKTSGETVILAQRGIGSPPTAMPRDWANRARKRHRGRIRTHPGKREAGNPLALDLVNCGRAITWGSGAAVKALVWGIPVVSEMPNWIGQQDNTDAGRLAMFRKMAWAQWRMAEIESGEAFAWLLI